MPALDVAVPTSILALLRGNVSPGSVAHRLGVTEAQVYEWQDVFVAAGTLALAAHQKGARPVAQVSLFRQTERGGDRTIQPTAEPENP